MREMCCKAVVCRAQWLITRDAGLLSRGNRKFILDAINFSVMAGTAPKRVVGIYRSYFCNTIQVGR